MILGSTSDYTSGDETHGLLLHPDINIFTLLEQQIKIDILQPRDWVKTLSSIRHLNNYNQVMILFKKDKTC